MSPNIHPIDSGAARAVQLPGRGSKDATGLLFSAELARETDALDDPAEELEVKNEERHEEPVDDSVDDAPVDRPEIRLDDVETHTPEESDGDEALEDDSLVRAPITIDIPTIPVPAAPTLFSGVAVGPELSRPNGPAQTPATPPVAPKSVEASPVVPSVEAPPTTEVPVDDVVPPSTAKEDAVAAPQERGPVRAEGPQRRSEATHQANVVDETPREVDVKSEAPRVAVPAGVETVDRPRETTAANRGRDVATNRDELRVQERSANNDSPPGDAEPETRDGDPRNNTTADASRAKTSEVASIDRSAAASTVLNPGKVTSTPPATPTPTVVGIEGPTSSGSILAPTATPIPPGGVPVQSIISQISLQLRNGGVRELKLRLDPPELGRLNLRFIMDGETLKVVVRASRPEVVTALKSELSTFHNSLKEAGVDLTSLDIDIEGHDRPNSTFNQSSDHSSDPSAPEARDASAPITPQTETTGVRSPKRSRGRLDVIA